MFILQDRPFRLFNLSPGYKYFGREKVDVRQNEFPGTFIVVEGADGAGTTTQSEKLAEKIDAEYTFEPTENKAGKKIDEMISSGDYSAEAIALMFAADRKVHLEEEVIPMLKDGKTVICDRYYHSSLVYQPTLGADYSWVKELNRDAIRPDITFLLDVSADIGMKRVDGRGDGDDNIFEELSFQEEVVKRYRRLPEQLDERIEVVDSTRPVEKVFSEIAGKLESQGLP